MRFLAFAVLMVAATPAVADEMVLPESYRLERRAIVREVAYAPQRVAVRRVVCVKCRSAGLPWGGLRPVRKASLPWGGLPDYCPPAVSRAAVIVTKG